MSDTLYVRGTFNEISRKLYDRETTREPAGRDVADVRIFWDDKGNPYFAFDIYWEEKKGGDKEGERSSGMITLRGIIQISRRLRKESVRENHKELQTKVRTGSFEYSASKWFYDEHKRLHPRLIVRLFSEVAEEWMAVVEKLQRIDGHSQDEIRKVFKFVVGDEFWSKQIRAVPKLRHSDKQDTPYFNLMLDKANGFKSPSPQQKPRGRRIQPGEEGWM